jgi:hypothetical protein
MAYQTSTETTITGTIRSVNERGLKLEGAAEWCNVSKFAVGVVLPERGAEVTCTLDKAGFLRAISLADGTLPAVVGGSDSPLVPRTSQLDRDRTITRLAVLKAAAEFAATREGLKSGHVLSIAASWEKWVMREEETTHDLDLTDAF